MRLFGKVDSAIDRFDRGEWVTPPFDLAFGAPVAADGSMICFRVVVKPSIRMTVSVTPSIGMTTSVRPAIDFTTEVGCDE